MQDCNYYEDCLMSGIPWNYRSLTKNILRSSQESQLMLQVFSNAITYALSSIPDRLPNILVSAVGSFGRLDGSYLFSDYDIIYIYEGSKDQNCIDFIRGIIKEVISANKALLFDHRDEIEAGTFDFDASPAYPIISTEELYQQEYEIRALQLLTEGRAIRSQDTIKEIKKDLMVRYGFKENINELDFRALIDALNSFKNDFCMSIIGRLVDSGKKLNNKKILKLFALREFFFVATLFSLAEISLGVAQNSFSVEDAIRKISAPSILKISSFADSRAPLADLLRNQMSVVKDQVYQIFEPRLQSIPLPGRISFQTSQSEAKEISYIRAISLAVLNKFEALIKYLHDPNFIAMIEQFEPDFTTWIGNRKFRHISTSREDLISTSKVMATALIEVLERISEANSCVDYDEAIKTLKYIENYDLVL